MALAEAIRKATRGEAILHPRVTARITQALHAAQNTPPPQAPPPPFTDRTQRELEVLRLIAQGLSNAAIAQQLVITSAR